MSLQLLESELLQYPTKISTPNCNAASGDKPSVFRIENAPIKMSEGSKQPTHDDNDDIAGGRFNCSACHQDLTPPDEATQRHPELLRHLREDCPYRRKAFLPLHLLVEKVYPFACNYNVPDKPV